MSQKIATFSTWIDSQWDRSAYPVAYSAQLSTANCNLGPALLNPDRLASAILEIDGYKALGVKAVSVSVSFPLLYAPFHQDPADYQGYLDFYTRLAGAVRERGLKLIVESRAVFTQATFAKFDVLPYYQSLTLDQYMAGRAENIVTVINAMRPDYISVITEPDTEASQVRKAELNTPAGSTRLLKTIMTRLQSVDRTGVAIGAGVGTWQQSYLSYVQGYASTTVDYIDMHVYPVNRDFLNRAVTIADLARSYNKKVAISEVWAYKIRDAELGQLPPDVIYSRDNFSFWSSIDAKFLEAMTKLAQFKKVEFMTAFFGEYFRGTLEYNDQTKTMSYDQLEAAVTPIQFTAMRTGQFSPTGLAYHGLLVKPADGIPPAPPVTTVQLAATDKVYATWPASSDNVGTAGYHVYRDGVRIATTAMAGYMDSGLADGKTFTYTVAAFDAAGNTSSLSASAQATTPDNTAPTAPASLSATPSGASQVNLSWTASKDNVAVSGYRVLRGTSPTSLAQVAFVTTPAYASTGLSAGVTYYHAVVAVDTAGKLSAQSTVVAATPTAPTPGVPTNVKATATSATQIALTWSASAGSVTGYRVYRGTSPAALRAIATTKATSFFHLGLAPNTTYYFAVATVGEGGVLSPMSSVVLAKTPTPRAGR